MSPTDPSPSSSSRDLTLVVESASGTPEEYFAQVGLSIGRATSNTIHIDHWSVDHIHAKMVRDGEGFSLQCEGQARLEVLEPEPGTFETVALIPGLTISLGGILIRCKRQLKGMGSLSDDYWADAAGGERFRVESESFTGDLPEKVGPYEIRKFVARGGMGIVLRGIHEDTDQPAAVKLPTPDLNKDQEWLKRFEQEVNTLKSITHPNLVRLQDAGKEGELHWMAMDWVEGETVANRITKSRETDKPIPLAEIQLIMLQVVAGLNHLHSLGVVHRDLKPSNLLLGQDGGVKVADFGLAKQVGGEQSTLLTRTGTFAGTMHYMAPEQSEGFDITPATDVYTLGVIWYELLTGKRPGGGRLKLGKFRPDCPENWGKLLEDCLDVDASDRANLAEVKLALEAERFEVIEPALQTEKFKVARPKRPEKGESKQQRGVGLKPPEENFSRNQLETGQLPIDDEIGHNQGSVKGGGRSRTVLLVASFIILLVSVYSIINYNDFFGLGLNKNVTIAPNINTTTNILAAVIKTNRPNSSVSEKKILNQTNSWVSRVVNYGRYTSKDPHVNIEATHDIPCKIGEMFGFRMTFEGVPDGVNIRHRVVHPPIIYPDGSTKLFDESAPMPPPEGARLFSWRFLPGEENELRTGAWTIMVFVGDDIAHTEVFNLVPPENLSDLIALGGSGDIRGQMKLGNVYDFGIGVEKSDSEAFYWYQRAAEQGSPKAQYSVGNFYEHGRAKEIDLSKAASWYLKSAEQGFTPAMLKIAEGYNRGYGLPLDFEKAFSWYQKAADQGSGDAQLKLSQMYAKGRGVQQDYVNAVVWGSIAYNNGISSGNWGLYYPELTDEQKNKVSKLKRLKMSNNPNLLSDKIKKDEEYKINREKHLQSGGQTESFFSISAMTHFEGPKIFNTYCASCHTYGGEDGLGGKVDKPSAPDLKGFASREYLTELLHPERYGSEKFFGNTAHIKKSKMLGFLEDEFEFIEESEMDQLVKAISAEAKLPSQVKVDKSDKLDIEAGHELFEEIGCVDCHSLGGWNADDYSAPDLTGYGSREWMMGIVKNPEHERFYGSKNDRMPAFGYEAWLERKDHEIAEEKYEEYLDLKAIWDELVQAMGGEELAATVMDKPEKVSKPSPWHRKPVYQLSEKQKKSLEAKKEYDQYVLTKSTWDTLVQEMGGVEQAATVMEKPKPVAKPVNTVKLKPYLSDKQIAVVVDWIRGDLRLEDPFLIEQGKQLFQTKVCFTCHQVDPAIPAPAGLALGAPKFIGDFWGEEREVHKGLGGPIEKVSMDESYFIESVRKPMDKVVKGALAPMPPTVPINDDELMALMAYVKSLSGAKEDAGK